MNLDEMIILLFYIFVAYKVKTKNKRAPEKKKKHLGYVFFGCSLLI